MLSQYWKRNLWWKIKGSWLNNIYPLYHSGWSHNLEGTYYIKRLPNDIKIQVYYSHSQQKWTTELLINEKKQSLQSHLTEAREALQKLPRRVLAKIELSNLL